MLKNKGDLEKEILKKGMKKSEAAKLAQQYLSEKEAKEARQKDLNKIKDR